MKIIMEYNDYSYEEKLLLKIEYLKSMKPTRELESAILQLECALSLYREEKLKDNGKRRVK